MLRRPEARLQYPICAGQAVAPIGGGLGGLVLVGNHAGADQDQQFGAAPVAVAGAEQVAQHGYTAQTGYFGTADAVIFLHKATKGEGLAIADGHAGFNLALTDGGACLSLTHPACRQQPCVLNGL
jgi:hypothetical protein